MERIESWRFTFGCAERYDMIPKIITGKSAAAKASSFASASRPA
jgi:hypothetical protein